MAPFQLLSTFEVPFSAIKTISGHLRQADYTEGSTVPEHILNKRYGHTFVLFWNKFHLKPIRSSICDCQHCLAATRAKWVFLHRLIKRHYCSLMSSSPCLSVGCVDYNCYHSLPLKSTLFLGLGCKGLFCFSLAGFCCHLWTYSATVLRTITSHNTYYYVSSMTVLEKGKLNKCNSLWKSYFVTKWLTNEEDVYRYFVLKYCLKRYCTCKYRCGKMTLNY